MTRVIFLMILALASLAPAAVSFDIPRVDQIKLDGDDADWGERGLHVDFMTSTSGRLFAAKDFAARCRIGWDDVGLLVLVRVSDDVRDENPADSPLGRNDSLELFVSAGPGSTQSYQFTVAAGAPGGKPRSALLDRRQNKAAPEKFAAEVAAHAFDGGYVVEVHLPWPTADTGKAGDSVGFQVRVNDTDKSQRKSLLWFPRVDTYANPNSMYRLVLSENASPPVRLAAQGDYDPGLSRADVTITALPDLGGKDVEVRAKDKMLGHAALGPAGEDGVCSAHPRLPMPARGETYGPLSIFVDGRTVAALNLPDAQDARARRLMTLPVVFQPGNYFTTAEFPSADFEQPLAAQQILGTYAIRTTFYDESYRVVTQAARPGRYGAVIEFIPDSDRPAIRRFRTIFRATKDLRLWQVKSRLTFDDPREAGLDPATAALGEEMLGDFASGLLDGAVSRDYPLPAVLAALSTTTRPSSADASPWRRNNDGFAQDRQWWVGLKRKLNGWEARWPEKFVAPRPIDGGTPATELRVGTPTEAGLTEAGLARLEQVCTDWARDGGEGFDVCVARHGVIAFNKPFGQRRGRPMTLDEKSRLASVTKIMSAAAMMMLVDQGALSLDDAVSMFLPAFAATDGKTPATIRHLYTHTAGLWGHWGDEMHDFDEVVGEYAPRLEVGKKYAYQGASQAVGGKILEAVTGEALPMFYLNHLLRPLGMDHTDVIDSASEAYSTSADLAKLGQMLLNRGAYGGHRFLKPETVEQMMSRPLTKVLGPSTIIEYGIGISAYKESPFGPRTFGHGAASSTIFRVSPDRDLVVMVARNNEGARYYEYEAKFFQAVAGALVKEQPASSRP